MKGILGRKLGMTEVFYKDGKLVPVTVIEIEPNVVTQIKTMATDGYNAIQLGYETVREKVSNKPKMGIAKKANTAPKRFLREVRNLELENVKLGDEVKADIFAAGDIVDITGTSKGKGFQGVIKRHNFSRGPMRHGSHFHRSPGSLGTMLPKRVFKGKKLPGHMGVATVTIQNIEIVSVDLEEGLILVKGNVPGPKKSLVIIKTAVKNEGQVTKPGELVSYIKETTPEVKEVIEEVATETEVIENAPEVAETIEEVKVEKETETPEVIEETKEENAEVIEEEKSAE